MNRGVGGVGGVFARFRTVNVVDISVWNHSCVVGLFCFPFVVTSLKTTLIYFTSLL